MVDRCQHKGSEPRKEEEDEGGGGWGGTSSFLEWSWLFESEFPSLQLEINRPFAANGCFNDWDAGLKLE